MSLFRAPRQNAAVWVYHHACKFVPLFHSHAAYLFLHQFAKIGDVPKRHRLFYANTARQVVILKETDERRREMIAGCEPRRDFLHYSLGRRPVSEDPKLIAAIEQG